MFDHLKKQESVTEEGDKIFGSVLETNVYDCTIDMAFADESTKGAAFMRLSLLTETGRTLSQTIYFTSGDAKGNSITYDVKGKDGKPTGEKKYLPGFIIASDLHEAVLDGVALADMNTEGKLVKVWDNEAKKEMPQEKAVLVDLIGKHIKLGIQEQIVTKQVNVEGDWKDTDEVRKQNEIVKVFHPTTNHTCEELKTKSDAEFMDKWIASYAGVPVDRTNGAKAATGATEGAGKKKGMFV